MLDPGNIQVVERLSVLKALGDNTRYAIFLELARSAVPLSTADIAETLDLHPNTVRPHLERMRDVGLLEVESDSRGAVGRPQHRYSLAPDAPSLGLEPSGFRLLARLVADVAARARVGSDEVAAVGRDQGRAAANLRLREEGRAGPAGGLGPRCVRALAAELADLGFDPALAEDGPAATIAFTHCPFRELAEAFPEVVCHLHRGIVEGFVEEAGGAAVTRFATLADRNPCEVDVMAG
jgi:predicted ArsR family transcriptional regulator